jgi:hypothetical protein
VAQFSLSRCLDATCALLQRLAALRSTSMPAANEAIAPKLVAAKANGRGRAAAVAGATKTPQ